MAKKVTLEALATQLQKMDARMQTGFEKLDTKINTLDARMERGFAAVAEDIGDIREKMAIKDQVTALHTQVNSIERQLRETKIEVRLGDLEEKVFGEARA